MTTMEGVIRPFQTTAEPVRVTAFNQVGVPTVLLNFGRSGSGRQLGGSFALEITFYQDQAVNELDSPASAMSQEMRRWSQLAIDNATKGS